ncbi:DUF1638 domain-containing protein [Methanimicrococcus blatticola]|uniref:Uncharacterized protein DUF1638 n=1 Tax=Methanimicrococcus blatticola TaxID=91560 RepID=A0A484F5E7_9EURY|nr:DUF1638 domain-containing protein [Methanimicrococcus blatticola]MBZ3935923.1 DUF1638 domain-containing protein [Methanimicrococcus blatticola]MCC2509464.1 DUF1638 domain-containing protein [Methanimicrococcus blatticola]TDQ68341.1 uncharacterized protein DUF1638 [Methanimicrococcus blatticola]
MTVMGILACKMLQDEIVYLIQKDSDISEVIVIENGEHEEFVQKLESFNISYRTVQDVKDLPDSDHNCSGCLTLVVWQLDLGLHEVPKMLKKRVYEEIPVFMPKADAIFLFYGLCGNVLADVESDFKNDACPVIILRDKDGIIIDDCIGGVLGGREEYAKVLKSFHGVGTFILTPMYASYAVKDFFGFGQASAGFTDQQMFELNKFMFESSGYKQVANLETGLHYTPGVEENIQSFADKYQLDVIQMSGGHQRLFEDCYKKVKNRLMPKE